MNLETLRLFRDVATLRSFSRGAEANRVSQSAASQAIQQLEKDLGVRLVDRTKRPLLLTPEGRVFHDGCRRLLAEFERAEAEMRAGREEVSGTVRVAAIYSIGFAEMSRHVRTFSARHPRAQVRVDYLRPDKVVAAVEDGHADLGILSYPRPGRALAVVPLREEEMAVVCRSRHRLARRRRVRPKALDGLPFIAFDVDLPVRRAIDRTLRRHGARPRARLAFDNIETIKQAVLAGEGVSILPLPTVREEVRRRRLAAIRLVLPGGGRLMRPIGVIHRRAAALPPAAGAFLETLRAAVKADRIGA